MVDHPADGSALKILGYRKKQANNGEKKGNK